MSETKDHRRCRFPSEFSTSHQTRNYFGEYVSLLLDIAMSEHVELQGIGVIRGLKEKSVDGFEFISFKGVPYAQPPVGKLRFRDPVPVEPWIGIKDASKFRSCCPQHNFLTREIVGNEDCLYLNVYVPCSREHKGSRKLAVMVWLHGGGFTHGSGDDFFYGPDYLIDKDIILVTINYRLGVLGFLNLNHQAATGNQGLKDQVLALRWIQEHIETFGGNKNNVTIFGESAGAVCVHYLCISPLAKGLFQRAIAQSGCGLCPWASIPRDPKFYASRLLEYLGNPLTDEVESVEFLRTIDSAKLVDAQMKIQTFQERVQVIWPFGPSSDDASALPFLPNLATLVATAPIDVPIIIGYNSAEALLLSKGFNEKSCRQINANFEWMLHEKVASAIRESKSLTSDEIKQAYFGVEPLHPERSMLQFCNICSDTIFVNGIHDFVKYQVKKSRHPIYLYRFSFDNGQSPLKLLTQTTHLPGACHGDELTYLFHPRGLKMLGSDAPKTGTKERKLIENMTRLWTDFAKTGNPTPTRSDAAEITWKPVKQPNELFYLKINDTFTIGLNPDSNRQWIWNKLTNKL